MRALSSVLAGWMALAALTLPVAGQASENQPPATAPQTAPQTEPQTAPQTPPTTVPAATAPTAALERPAPLPAVPLSKRLSTEMMRAALAAAATSPLTVEALDVAVLLAGEACALDPDSIELWRLALDLAGLAEDEALRDQALEQLSRLDPADERVRLSRLNRALERYQTVAQRVEACEQLISDENVPRLGAPIASRLALDLALLRQREGDTQAFARHLARALQLDRSNRTAAAIAAGFYRANVADVVGEAELLVNLFLADPTDIATQIDLAQLLLDHGAYNGAYRMFNLAVQGLRANQSMPSTQLMADMAIAQWATGDADSALLTIERRQAEIDETYRVEAARSNRRLTRADVAQIRGPVDPTLASVAAVIKAGRGAADAAESLEAAIAAYEADITRLKAADPPAEAAELAALHLEIAWLALWLGADAERPMTLVAEAEALHPLSEAARTRFEGWKALKQSDARRAVDLHSPLAADDPAARVGLAIALMQLQQTREAARELLALNRAQPGSMIGIWAAGELARLLGQRVPLAEHAANLERLIASIPQALDRYPRDGSLALVVRTSLENPNPGPYEPVRVRVELINNTSLPLAIDRAGPIRPQLLCIAAINTASPIGDPPRPFVVEFDTRLRLAPRESVTVAFDLRHFGSGDVFNAMAVSGGIVKLTMQTNFVANPAGAIVPGLYGCEVQAPLVRIDGVRKEPQWLERATALLTVEPGTASDGELAMTTALVANEIAHAALERDITPERRRTIQTAGGALPAAYARLPAAEQAWVLASLPHALDKEPLLAMARKSESRLVRMAYLVFHLTGPDDPMLDAARRGEDPPLRRLADGLAKSFERAGSASAPATRGAATQPSR